MTSGTCPTIRLRLNCLWTSSQDFHQGGLEKGAVWSYRKHHYSINTQSSLGKLEQLDIQQGQSGQVQAHQGLLWLGNRIRAITHQSPNSAKHLVPSGSYQHKLIKELLLVSMTIKEVRMATIPPPSYSNILPTPAQNLAWGGSRPWGIPNKCWFGERGKEKGASVGSVEVGVQEPVLKSKLWVCDVNRQQPSLGEPQVLFRHVVPTQTS